MRQSTLSFALTETVKFQLPDLPKMELIKNVSVDIEPHLTSRKVKYGGHEFMECTDGYILCYIHAYLRRKEPQDAFYGVYYGSNNPL